MKFTRKILAAVICWILLLSLSACSGGYDSSKSCYVDDKSPAKKFVTNKGTERYYCKAHVKNCGFCDKKATKNYTNLMDFHIFVCDEHYRDAAE